MAFELYALPGVEHSTFIHVKFVWGPINPQKYLAVAQNLQLSIATFIRYHTNQPLPNDGISQSVGKVDLIVKPAPERRIHMLEYIEDRPDGNIVLIDMEDQPTSYALKTKGSEPEKGPALLDEA
ncbi:MAG: hypothetical protein Q9166_001979 [cf. Caloplaca sp. 2 TL-2023]